MAGRLWTLLLLVISLAFVEDCRSLPDRFTHTVTNTNGSGAGPLRVALHKSPPILKRVILMPTAVGNWKII